MGLPSRGDHRPNIVRRSPMARPRRPTQKRYNDDATNYTNGIDDMNIRRLPYNSSWETPHLFPLPGGGWTTYNRRQTLPLANNKQTQQTTQKIHKKESTK